MSDIRCYSVRVATLHGPDCATFINHLQYRIGENRSEGKYFYDGRYWTYNSTSSLIGNIYPYWTKKQMNLIINKLVDKGVILVGNYNKMPGDKTRWYAFVDQEIFLEPKSVNPVKHSSRENAECSVEPKNKDKSPQTVAAVNGAKTHLGIHKDFHDDSSSETVGTKQGAKTHLPCSQKGTAIPLINSNKKEREERSENSKPVVSVSCRNATPSFSEESKKVLKEKKARGARLSPTWELPDADREWGLTRGIFNEHIDIQADRFKDYWIATTKNAVKLDWSATWRNWLRNAKDVHLKEPISNLIKGLSQAQAEQPPHRTCDDPKIKKWYDSKGMDIDSRMGAGTWVSWFERLEVEKFSSQEAVLKAPTRFLAEWFEKPGHMDHLRESLKKIDPDFPQSSSIQVIWE